MEERKCFVSESWHTPIFQEEATKGDTEETTKEAGNKTGRFILLETEEQRCLNNNGYQ